MDSLSDKTIKISATPSKIISTDRVSESFKLEVSCTVIDTANTSTRLTATSEK